MIRRINTSIENERGNLLLITAAVIVVLIIAFAGLTEFGRYLIMREQAQTAADAAALAAATSGTKTWVKIDVYTYCGASRTKDGCESCGTRVVRGVIGTERDLIDRGEWIRYTTPQCECSCGGLQTWYEIVDRWVEYKRGDQAQAAGRFFQANRPTFAETADVRSVEVRRYPTVWETVRQDYAHIDYLNANPHYVTYPVPDDLRQDPFYPSVVVRAEAWMKTLWDGFLGIFRDRKANVCAQGDTFYQDPQTGRWIKPPDEACVPR
ncbi:pilus assembly protein TadG-related protein [Hydrogenibacillus schlegelii]|uniref:pilus assembly protein TadG-related protein n=1 Tax=Hydrogenibacillus schlegelii TaxID=1484 RepID=UPI002355522F|nr:pilus assembly protein TadG-related protein [Hydrogenibacillus schlegelii]